MATAIGLAEQGFRRNGRWERNSIAQQSCGIAGTSDRTYSEYLKRAGIILDYDADRGTNFADKVLAGMPLGEAHKAVTVNEDFSWK